MLWVEIVSLFARMLRSGHGGEVGLHEAFPPSSSLHAEPKPRSARKPYHGMFNSGINLVLPPVSRLVH